MRLELNTTGAIELVRAILTSKEERIQIVTENDALFIYMDKVDRKELRRTVGGWFTKEEEPTKPCPHCGRTDCCWLLHG